MMLSMVSRLFPFKSSPQFWASLLSSAIYQSCDLEAIIGGLTCKAKTIRLGVCEDQIR